MFLALQFLWSQRRVPLPQCSGHLSGCHCRGYYYCHWTAWGLGRNDGPHTHTHTGFLYSDCRALRRPAVSSLGLPLQVFVSVSWAQSHLVLPQPKPRGTRGRKWKLRQFGSTLNLVSFPHLPAPIYGFSPQTAAHACCPGLLQPQWEESVTDPPLSDRQKATSLL